MKIYYKWIAFAIALSVIMCSMPVSALALNVDSSAGDLESCVAKKTDDSADVKKELKEKKGLGIVEIESLREKQTKHYQMSDGTYQALSFGAPIHRKGKDGKWQDIDNRLYKENESYKTKDGWFSFAANLSSGEIYSVNSEEYSFTVSYALSVSKSVGRTAPAQTPLAVVKNHAEKTSLSAYKTDAEKMDAIASIDNTTRVFYEDVYEGVDFEYIISSNDVKENIILNTNSGKHEFVFYIESVGLKAEMASNGSIQLLDIESEECAYCIPAPYMYDSEGDYSYNVQYSLLEKSNGRYEIKIIADESWLNSSETVYPVVIDPTITQLAMFDTYIYSSYPTTNYGGSEQLWVSSSRISYIRTPMPTLPEYARISFARLNVKYYYNDTVSSGNVNIGLYKCLKSWHEYGLTWNGANTWTNKGLSTDRSASATATATDTTHATTPGTISFNVYELVKQWYAGETNYGVGLKYESGSNSSVVLCSFETSNEYRATFSIIYVIATPVIENGTYFIQNGHLKNYLQIGDEYAPDYTDENAILELWDFDGGDYQKWNITFLHNGYYKIASAQSGKVISVKEGEEDEGDVSLRMTTYTASANQQWAISMAHEGQYKIDPKSSVGCSTDWCMAAGSAVIESITDGRNVEQREYTDNTGYKDEWVIVPFRNCVYIGMSTDNYTDGCTCGVRQSYRYANKFYGKLLENSSENIITGKVHHYNKDSVRTASKDDFSENGTFVDSIDFMIYIGHGLKAENSSGNMLHYNCAVDETYHTTDCYNSAYNVYSGDVNFGSASSDLRWVWLYTCNFLTTSEYVTDASLKEMMTGVHIVMGYASKATLCDAMAETFAEYLSEGEPIIEAYFAAGHDGEASVEDAAHYQKVLYIPQALNETIYSESVDYEYSVSDVYIEVRSIHLSVYD